MWMKLFLELELGLGCWSNAERHQETDEWSGVVMMRFELVQLFG